MLLLQPSCVNGVSVKQRTLELYMDPVFYHRAVGAEMCLEEERKKTIPKFTAKFESEMHLLLCE